MPTTADAIHTYSQKTFRTLLRPRLVATIRIAQEGNPEYPPVNAALALIERARAETPENYQRTLMLARATAAGFCDEHNNARAPHLWHLGRAVIIAAASSVDASIFRESLANLAAYLRGPDAADLPLAGYEDIANAADARIYSILQWLE